MLCSIYENIYRRDIAVFCMYSYVVFMCSSLNKYALLRIECINISLNVCLPQQTE